MTQDNRETMQRAIGMIEGAYCVAKPQVQHALQCAVEMLDEVMNKEEEREEK